MNIVHLSYPLTETDRRAVPAEGQTLAIGDFDGVHVGHREVIRRAVQEAKRQGLASSVMTFDPHPREVLGSPAYSTWITPLPRKLELLQELGIDTTYVVAFDLSLAALSPGAFVDEVLKPLNVKSVSIGFNFTFGHRGAGTAVVLRELGEGAFEVNAVEPQQIAGERVSSTSIREALAEGDVERVAALLGRPYALAGLVVAGDGRGRTIGVPTANLSISDRCVRPANGVYAIEAEVETGRLAGRRYQGVMNVGFKPTFHNALPEPTWEAHLFDFEGDLYDQRLKTTFLSRIRNERKFDSVAALIAQIERDIEEAKRRFRKDD
ncbi:bifunctional riboflavin kinase/FAD synthetase [Paenibacillus sp.]|uniref:bifunctional riboflavin kinase/FAD synthetase n=1 Tax=Paenibacillus sp. TaxID=58172 RepID=UPI002D679D0D|nr:bifunctional riboflavin kinase/FAD synthetase [Paenibacillus sp.]HZG57326.1 bifunctional riboflavin kinase/FAD synthetase [Paenibacillus sp.]